MRLRGPGETNDRDVDATDPAGDNRFSEFTREGATMPGRTREILSWAVWWSAVYAANTALPLAFFLSTRTDVVTRGQFGAWAGAWVVWAGWLVAGAASARLRATLTLGGAVVALTQLVPLLQIGAALAGDAVADRLVSPLATSPPLVIEYKGFVAAVTTGQLVVGIVLVVGSQLAPRPRRHHHARVETVLVRCRRRSSREVLRDQWTARADHPTPNAQSDVSRR